MKGAIITAAVAWMVAWGCIVLTGCASNRAADPAAEQRRNIARSRQLNARGMDSSTTPQDSIALFAAAIKAHPFNGAAHNNLGTALLTRRNYYDAAKHFEQAIRLLPAHPDPRVNLGSRRSLRGDLGSRDG